MSLVRKQGSVGVQGRVQLGTDPFCINTIDAIDNPETHIPRQITVSGMLIEGETVR